MNHFPAYLDKVKFLRFSAWDFSFRSAFKEYGRFFLFRILLSHPIQTIRGLGSYKKFLKKNKNVAPRYHHFLFIPQEDEWLKKIMKQDSQPLVGLGFCLKPYKESRTDLSCPSGRANHDCLFLESGQTQSICLECDIWKTAKKCLERGYPVYIMTSALDMARDVMAPQIKSGKFPLSILFLCPYSVRVILLPLFICGVEAFLVAYGSGYCRDYEEWRRADLGEKEDKTALSFETWKKVEEVFAISPLSQTIPRSFKREGNIFFPNFSE